MKVMLRFLSCASLLAVIVVFAAAEPGKSAEAPVLKEHMTIQAPASSNSSSCTITITMTGDTDDEDYGE